MKKGLDIHDFNHRMKFAGLRENQNVSFHNRLKILGYLETQEIGLPSRIKFLLNLGRSVAMLRTDFEKATEEDIETVLLECGRLEFADETNGAASALEGRN